MLGKLNVFNYETFISKCDMFMQWKNIKNGDIGYIRREVDWSLECHSCVQCLMKSI